jgi:hypothetical protein
VQRLQGAFIDFIAFQRSRWIVRRDVLLHERPRFAQQFLIDDRPQEKAKGFDQPTTFSIYWLLRQQCGCDDPELAIDVDRTIAEHPYRDMNPENMRQLRLRLTVALIKPLGKEKVADAIDRLLALDRKEP